MGLLFNNYLEKGYYELDDYGTYTKLDNMKDILKAQQQGTLYENDGMATTKINDGDRIIQSENKSL